MSQGMNVRVEKDGRCGRKYWTNWTRSLGVPIINAVRRHRISIAFSDLACGKQIEGSLPEKDSGLVHPTVSVDFHAGIALQHREEVADDWHLQTDLHTEHLKR